MVLYITHGLLKFSKYVWPSDKVTAQVTGDYKWMQDHRRPRSTYLYVTYVSETLRTPFLSQNPKLSRILYYTIQSIQYILNEAWIVLRLHHILKDNILFLVYISLLLKTNRLWLAKINTYFPIWIIKDRHLMLSPSVVIHVFEFRLKFT